MKKLLPFCCLFDAMCRYYGLSEVWLQRPAFFVDANCFAALSLQPLGVPKLKTQTAGAQGFITKWMSKIQRCESDKDLIVGMRELASIYLIPCTSPSLIRLRRYIFIVVGPSSVS